MARDYEIVINAGIEYFASVNVETKEEAESKARELADTVLNEFHIYNLDIEVKE